VLLGAGVCAGSDQKKSVQAAIGRKPVQPAISGYVCSPPVNVSNGSMADG